jgi:hypothetical protein
MLKTQLKWSKMRSIAEDLENATQLRTRQPGHARCFTHVMFTSAHEPQKAASVRSTSQLHWCMNTSMQCWFGKYMLFILTII